MKSHTRHPQRCKIWMSIRVYMSRERTIPARWLSSVNLTPPTEFQYIKQLCSLTSRLTSTRHVNGIPLGITAVKPAVPFPTLSAPPPFDDTTDLPPNFEDAQSNLTINPPISVGRLELAKSNSSSPGSSVAPDKSFLGKTMYFTG